MTRKVLTLALGAILVLAAGTPALGQTAEWIHIRVTEDEGTNVNVNLPMSLITVAMEIAQQHVSDEAMDFGDDFDGRISFGRHHDMEVEDLRKMWQELRDAGDADYVQVEDGDETVNIYRRGERVFIEVDEDGDEKVRMQVPFSVVDVLLDGEGNELNLVGALNEMAQNNDGEVLQVNDGDTTVRIWIDDNPQG
ncbi:MAG: hypothetical protein GKS06_08400 [Acidobacteria bacterium]|nr:hypothetical protein [Acidobacteriota bacterium]